MPLAQFCSHLLYLDLSRSFRLAPCRRTPSSLGGRLWRARVLLTVLLSLLVGNCIYSPEATYQATCLDEHNCILYVHIYKLAVPLVYTVSRLEFKRLTFA